MTGQSTAIEAPDPHRPELYEEAARVVRKFKDEYWIVGVTVTTIFECAWALRGYEALLMDFAANPALAERILDIPYRYHLAAAAKLVRTGRRYDLDWRRCRDADGHADLSCALAPVSQAKNGAFRSRR